MKKFLLSLVAAAFVATSASAQMKVARSFTKPAAQPSALKTYAGSPLKELAAKRPMRAMQRTTVTDTTEQNKLIEDIFKDRSKYVSHMTAADTSSSLILFDVAPAQTGFYVRYTPDVLSRYAGNKIKSLLTLGPLGRPSGMKMQILEITADGVREVWSESTEMEELGLVTITDIDYTITESSDLLIGYSGTINKSGLFSDEQTGGAYGLPLVKTLSTDQGLYWLYSDGSLYSKGSQVFSDSYAQLEMYVLTEGEQGLKMLDLGNVAMENVRGDLNNGLETIVTGQLKVMGLQPMQSFEYNYEIGGKTYTNSVSAPEGQAFGYGSTISFPVVARLNHEVGRENAKLTITKVNGQPDQYSANGDNEAYSNVVTIHGGMPRNAVLEEFTSNSCGWCPRGIVGMEKAKEALGDRLIVLSAHTTFVGEANAQNPYHDPLYDASYQTVINQLATAFPSAVLNREQFGLDPYYGLTGDIVEDIKPIASSTCEAGMVIGAKRTSLGKKIEVTTKVRFAKKVAQGEYGISYVVTEDNITNVDQWNYYYGYAEAATSDDLLPLVTAPVSNTVIIDGQEIACYRPVYNDVTRLLSSVEGSEEANLIPAIDDYSMYTHTATLEMPTGFQASTSKKVNVTALIIDQTTGCIVQAVRCPLSSDGKQEGATTGIETIDAPSADISVLDGAFCVKGENAKAAVYSLDGRLVSSATVNGEATLPTFGKGTFIIRVQQDGNITSKKVMF